MGSTSSSQPQCLIRLPLPISKNRRLRMSRRQTWAVEAGVAFQKSTPVIGNTKDWGAYKRDANLLVLEARAPDIIGQLKPGEKLVVACRWFLADERSDCVNFHDLLADALKEPLGIDDVHFLVRDTWCELDVADPRVEVTLSKERSPASRPSPR